MTFPTNISEGLLLVQKAVQEHVRVPSQRGAVIKDGVVINTVVLPMDWPGNLLGGRPIPEDLTVIVHEGAAIGDVYRDGKLYRTMDFIDADRNPLPDFEYDIDNPPPRVEFKAERPRLPTEINTIKDRLDRIEAALTKLVPDG